MWKFFTQKKGMFLYIHIYIIHVFLSIITWCPQSPGGCLIITITWGCLIILSITRGFLHHLQTSNRSKASKPPMAIGEMRDRRIRSSIRGPPKRRELKNHRLRCDKMMDLYRLESHKMRMRFVFCWIFFLGRWNLLCIQHMIHGMEVLPLWFTCSVFSRAFFVPQGT